MIIHILTWGNDTIKVVKTCHGFNNFYSRHDMVSDEMITEKHAQEMINELQLKYVDKITTEISVSVTI